MKQFDEFIEEAATKRCPEGEYFCNDMKKCRPVPKGCHVDRGGILVKDKE